MGLQTGVTFFQKWGYKTGFWRGGIRGGKNTIFSAIASKKRRIDTPKIP